MERRVEARRDGECRSGGKDGGTLPCKYIVIVRVEEWRGWKGGGKELWRKGEN